MAKTIYEGLRVGKNGGERWSGTIRREASTGRFANAEQSKTPKGGSVIRTAPARSHPKADKK